MENTKRLDVTSNGQEQEMVTANGQEQEMVLVQGCEQNFGKAHSGGVNLQSPSEDATGSKAPYVDHYRDPIVNPELIVMESKVQQATQRKDSWSVSSPFRAYPVDEELAESAKTLSFPLLIYRMLSEAPMKGFEHIVCWCSHGRAFKVHDVDAFERFVMPM